MSATTTTTTTGTTTGITKPGAPGWFKTVAMWMVAVGVLVSVSFFWHPWASIFVAPPRNDYAITGVLPGTVPTKVRVTEHCSGGMHNFNELNLREGVWTPINPYLCRLVYDIKQGSITLGDGVNEAPASSWINFMPTQAILTSGPLVGFFTYCPTNTKTKPVNWECELV
jgi:hypothetical protein